jgi:SRSO17 transposase
MAGSSGTRTKEVIGMDADTIMKLKPALTEFLHEFDGYFGRVTTRGYLDQYVMGQLSDLERKSVEPIADAAGVPPRSLQEFLSLFRWDEAGVRDELQRLVAQRHAHSHSVGVLDETSFLKKGDKTACVQRQHCGSVGKTDNCVVSVHLGYVAGDFHTLLDGDLYLPEKTWHENRTRCRAAGIPDEVVYRPKWRIAQDQIIRALGNGVRFSWLTFDEYYGSKPAFLRALDQLSQNYVAELPSTFIGWTRPPEVLYRELARNRRTGRPRTLPRLKVRNTPFAGVRNILRHSPVLRGVPWVRYRVKEGSKGPMAWEAKRIPFWIKDENGLPSRPHHLLIARNAVNPDEVKFFLSNAPQSVSIQTLLLVAFSRWRIERMFEDSKTELGLDHFEVRKYLSIRRHLILTCVSHLFVAEFWLEHRGKKSRADRLPSANRHEPPGADLVRGWPMLPEMGRTDQRAAKVDTASQRKGSQKSQKTNRKETPRNRHQTARSGGVFLVESIAL